MSSLRVTFAALLACASLTASAWWETTVTTNKWEYDGVEYLENGGTAFIETDYYANANSLAVCDAQFLSAVSQYSLFGYSKNSSGGTTGSALSFQVYINGNIKFASALNYGTSGDWLASSMTADTNRHTFSLDASTGVFMIDSTRSTHTGTISGTTYLPIRVFMGSRESSGITIGDIRLWSFRVYESSALVRSFVPVVHEGEGKMLDLVHGTLYANAGTGAFSYGSVTGKVVTAFDRITTNRVYHANPPASAYDALSPWNAPERTRLGGDARTLRPSAQIKQD